MLVGAENRIDDDFSLRSNTQILLGEKTQELFLRLLLLYYWHTVHYISGREQVNATLRSAFDRDEEALKDRQRIASSCMKIEIINTGSELLLGYVLNTHQQWLCRQLSDNGYRVERQLAIND